MLILLYLIDIIITFNEDFTKNYKLYFFYIQIAVEAIGSIRTVVSLGCEKLLVARYTEELVPYIVSSKRKSHFKSFMLGVAKSLMYFAYAAGLSYGAKIIVTEKIHYGIVFK